MRRWLEGVPLARRWRDLARRRRRPNGETTEARWARVTRIVDGAARRPDSRERARYLKAACAGDRELRREVERLLSFEHADSGILGGLVERAGRKATDSDAETPTAVTRPATPTLLEPGQQVGPYRIERRLGSGGMGVVALAYDPTLERRVALKVIRREMVSGELLRRFETERRVLARLEHPNIARIFDAGTIDDLPYFTMERVEGEPIDRFCDRQRLSITDRLRLVLKVCDALENAHRNLVVHRDLKPSNILVGAAGEPKLLDFGIAKELGPAGDSETRHQPLTPAYASPEQLRGRPVSVASDVYSLGVLLYRLLCGHPPYLLDADGYENLRKVCEEPPPPPSTRAMLAPQVWRDGAPEAIAPAELAGARRTDPRALNRRLAGDLDAIVGKALAKDPRDRYRSMERFAADLRRHLDGQPVAARRATAGYRAAKFLRRHRWRLAAAAVIATSLFAGGGAWLLSQQRLRASADERRRATEQAEQAERQADALTLFARNLVLATDPDASGGGPLSAQEILTRGEEQARSSLSEEPESLAHQLEAIGVSYQALGSLEAAGRLLEESLQLRQEVYGGDHALVARGLNNLAALCHVAGERQRAEDLYRQALRMKRHLGQAPADLAKVESNLASLLTFRGAYDEAEALYRRVLETRRRAYGPDDADVGNSLRSLGNLLYLKGDFAAAEARLREALALREQAHGAENTRVAGVLSNLGRVLHARDRWPEAEAALRRALEIRIQRLGEDHLHTALTRKDLASLYFDLGEDAVAEEMWSRALAVLHAEKPPDCWELADADSQLGARLAAEGRFEEAEPLLIRGHRILERDRGERSVYARRARARLDGLDRSRDVASNQESQVH